MPSHNPIPLATDNVQCIKCLKPISENQSYSQCDTCIQYIHSSCMNSKKSKKQSLPNNRQFTCGKCSQCPICVRKVAINTKQYYATYAILGYTSNAINFLLMIMNYFNKILILILHVYSATIQSFHTCHLTMINSLHTSKKE